MCEYVHILRPPSAVYVSLIKYSFGLSFVFLPTPPSWSFAVVIKLISDTTIINILWHYYKKFIYYCIKGILFICVVECWCWASCATHGTHNNSLLKYPPFTIYETFEPFNERITGLIATWRVLISALGTWKVANIHLFYFVANNSTINNIVLIILLW